MEVQGVMVAWAVPRAPSHPPTRGKQVLVEVVGMEGWAEVGAPEARAVSVVLVATATAAVSTLRAETSAWPAMPSTPIPVRVEQVDLGARAVEVVAVVAEVLAAREAVVAAANREGILDILEFLLGSFQQRTVETEGMEETAAQVVAAVTGLEGTTAAPGAGHTGALYMSLMEPST